MAIDQFCLTITEDPVMAVRYYCRLCSVLFAVLCSIRLYHLSCVITASLVGTFLFAVAAGSLVQYSTIYTDLGVQHVNVHCLTS